MTILQATLRFEGAFSGRRIPVQRFGRPHGSTLECAAAVRAPALQTHAGAFTAEGALERTNHGLAGIRRKIAIAALAIWLQEQHASPMASARMVSIIRQASIFLG
jgi:hypothetical protein